MSIIRKLRNLPKCPTLLVTLVLLSPSAASASPITTGEWSQVTDVDGDRSSFWDGASWDCATCNVGHLLASYTGLAGLEYLNNGVGSFVPFRFDNPVIEPELIFNITAWTGGLFGRDATGAFTYDSLTRRVSNSWTRPEQFALFRRAGTETTQYFMGIEDILLSERLNDRDYNDYIVTFTTRNTVPEPATLLLMGVSLVGLAARRMRRPGASVRGQNA